MRRIIKNTLWGFVLALFGASSIGMIGVAVFDFIRVASVSGWHSVFYFFAGICALSSALISFWLWGTESKKRTKMIEEYHNTPSTAPDKIEKF